MTLWRSRTVRALLFDVPRVEFGHHGTRCSFDAFVEKYSLSDDSALAAVAEIVRGADTAHRDLTPESAGLYPITAGMAALSPSRFPDDHALVAVESQGYDALYEYRHARAGA